MGHTQKRSLLIGGLFTLLVVGLLIYLHSQPVQHEEVVPDKVVVDVETKKAPGIWVCDGNIEPPYCKGEELAEALSFWADLGCAVEAVDTGPCPDVCTFTYEEDGEQQETKLPCKSGWTSVVPVQYWEGETHVGRTYLPKGDGDAVIAIAKIDAAWDPTVEIERPPLPDDITKLVCAHEIGHSFNKGHTYTEVGNTGVVARKKGEIMHPSIFDVGWSASGLGCE